MRDAPGPPGGASGYDRREISEAVSDRFANGQLPVRPALRRRPGGRQESPGCCATQPLTIEKRLAY